jgi:YadA-like membrane anchor domain
LFRDRDIMKHFKKTGRTVAALLLLGHLAVPALAAGVVQGIGATNSGTDGVALGDGTNASDTFAVGIGTGANAAGDHAIAIGHQSTAGNQSIILGGHATGGANAVGIGENVTVQDTGVAIGNNATSTGDGVALGADVNATAGQVAIGSRKLVGSGGITMTSGLVDFTGVTSNLGTLNSANITNTGNISTSTLNTSGLATLGAGANITGSTAINTTGTAPTVIGNTDPASTVALKGGSGSLDVTNASSRLNNNGNGLTVFQTAQTVGSGQSINDNLKNAQYVNKLQGNTLIDGNMYVNGMLNYVTSQSATTQVNGANAVGTSILSNPTQGTVGQLSIVNKGSNGATESSASLTMQNGIGNTHGLEVYENRTVLSGGANSTQMLLQDNSVTFSNKQTGAPVKVTGIANGTSTYDAVNFGQLKDVEKQMSRGIAMASALSGIPQVESGKTFSLGAGTGVYNGQTAISVGGSYRFSPNAIVKVGIGLANGEQPAGNAGIAYSW